MERRSNVNRRKDQLNGLTHTHIQSVLETDQNIKEEVSCRTIKKLQIETHLIEVLEPFEFRRILSFVTSP